MGYISTNCKNKDEDNSSKKKLFKKYNKKKNGKACSVEWDSDSDSSDNDDVKPSNKGLAGIAIKEAPSLFNTPYCLLAKGELQIQWKTLGV
jgi:hypothetical protein